MYYIHGNSNSLDPRFCVSIIWIEIPVRNGLQHQQKKDIASLDLPNHHPKKACKDLNKDTIWLNYISSHLNQGHISGRFYHPNKKISFQDLCRHGIITHPETLQQTPLGCIKQLASQCRDLQEINSGWNSWQSYPSWWLNQPLWKICSSNSIISPNSGENRKYLKPPPSILDLPRQDASHHQDDITFLGSGILNLNFYFATLAWWLGKQDEPNTSHEMVIWWIIYHATKVKHHFKHIQVSIYVQNGRSYHTWVDVIRYNPPLPVNSATFLGMVIFFTRNQRVETRPPRIRHCHKIHVKLMSHDRDVMMLPTRTCQLRITSCKKKHHSCHKAAQQFTNQTGKCLRASLLQRMRSLCVWSLPLTQRAKVIRTDFPSKLPSQKGSKKALFRDNNPT